MLRLTSCPAGSGAEFYSNRHVPCHPLCCRSAFLFVLGHEPAHLGAEINLLCVLKGQPTPAWLDTAQASRCQLSSMTVIWFEVVGWVAVSVLRYDVEEERKGGGLGGEADIRYMNGTRDWTILQVLN